MTSKSAKGSEGCHRHVQLTVTAFPARPQRRRLVSYLMGESSPGGYAPAGRLVVDLVGLSASDAGFFPRVHHRP